MTSAVPITGILHYTVSPVVGGVEAVIDAHLRIFAQNGFPVSVVAGRGSEEALPQGSRLELIREVDSQYPDILAARYSLSFRTYLAAMCRSMKYGSRESRTQRA